jgi:hypothetical protein
MPRVALAHPDCATLSPSKPATQSDLVGLHRQAWTRRPWAVWGGVGHCTRRVPDSILHCKRHFTRAARRPQRPALPMRPCGSTRSGRPDARFATKAPPRAPGRQTRARCVRRAALGRWASSSAPPPSLGRAPIPPDSSISKSGPRDLEFEYPGVVFKIERVRHKIDTRGESSTTRACSRHGFALAPRCCRQSCSTRSF